MSVPSPDAADPSVSAWVSAHAGTGKTYTLANRVARLLLEDAKPAKILCLTYTKAAAAEMQGRLFDQLGKWSMLPDAELDAALQSIGAGVQSEKSLRKARRLFADALETPGGLKIQTIHSFCQYLLARFPLEAGVTPAFDVLDEPTARELIDEAERRVLARAGANESPLADATAFLATQTDESRLKSLLDSALGGERRKLERLLTRHGSDQDSLAMAVARAHDTEPGANHEDFARQFCADMEAARHDLEAIARWLESGSVTDKRLAEALKLAVTGGEFELFQRVFFTTGGTRRKSLATKKLADTNPDLLAAFEEAANRFEAAENRCRNARAASLAQAALTLAQAALGEYTALKRARGVLDYDDLIAASLRLLARADAAAWVLFKLDGGLDHVLIDEGQDTSPEQWQIVRALTEEMFAGEGAPRGDDAARTLFVVGDEKQSIFSFQGADPKQFEINRTHFASRAGEGLVSVELSQSRRSAPEILRFVDAVFASDEAREGVSSHPVKHETVRLAAPGRVELWPTLKPMETAQLDGWQRPIDLLSPSSPVVRLAVQVATRIKGWTDGRTRLAGHDRAIRPGDIMVLMPRREPFATELIRQLKQRDVPVAGADRIRLCEQIAVMDLVALGRFVLLPEDDLNLAALLRSPLLGFSEDDLYGLAQPRKGSLWRELQMRREDLPASAAAHTFLSEMRTRADFAPPYEFYAHALSASGMRKRLLARLGIEASDAIDEFHALCLAYERFNTPSLEGFLHWLERADAEVKRDMERGRNEVRVMTVHGAKGLEADIVVLPDTTTLPDGGSRHAALLYDDDAAFFPVSGNAAPDCVTAVKEAAKADALREHRRLLYVALTRARDQLHICGFEGAHGVKDGSWYALMAPVAKALGIAVKQEGEDELCVIGEAGMEETAKEDDVAIEISLPGWARTIPRNENVRPRLIRPSEAADQAEPTRLSPLAGGGAKAFQRGNLLHTLLAHLPDLPHDARARAASRYLAQQDVDEGARQALVAEAMAVLDHSDFAAAFSPRSRAETAIVAELPELGDGARVNGRLDRIAVTETRVLAVDFKSNRPAPRDLASVPQLYLSQMALYRAALAKIFPDKTIDCALVWTETPRLMPLPAELLDAELARIGAKAAEVKTPHKRV
ncbi:MAG TPA: double-strand break repair helicase AddA [Rhizomicrobium sp.]|jgi:ATP-dependent helicase/nuclease subunit A